MDEFPEDQALEVPGSGGPGVDGHGRPVGGSGGPGTNGVGRPTGDVGTGAGGVDAYGRPIGRPGVDAQGRPIGGFDAHGRPLGPGQGRPGQGGAPGTGLDASGRPVGGGHGPHPHLVGPPLPGSGAHGGYHSAPHTVTLPGQDHTVVNPTGGLTVLVGTGHSKQTVIGSDSRLDGHGPVKIIPGPPDSHGPPKQTVYAHPGGVTVLERVALNKPCIIFLCMEDILEQARNKLFTPAALAIQDKLVQDMLLDSILVERDITQGPAGSAVNIQLVPEVWEQDQDHYPEQELEYGNQVVQQVDFSQEALEDREVGNIPEQLQEQANILVVLNILEDQDLLELDLAVLGNTQEVLERDLANIQQEVALEPANILVVQGNIPVVLELVNNQQEVDSIQEALEQASIHQQLVQEPEVSIPEDKGLVREEPAQALVNIREALGLAQEQVNIQEEPDSILLEWEPELVNTQEVRALELDSIQVNTLEALASTLQEQDSILEALEQEPVNILVAPEQEPVSIRVEVDLELVSILVEQVQELVSIQVELVNILEALEQQQVSILEELDNILLAQEQELDNTLEALG
uniref:Uncharacterized protein n=1 Tax=Anopheles stephensi TaxID=30069 RepID=A0A182XYM6_ANOST